MVKFTSLYPPMSPGPRGDLTIDFLHPLAVYFLASLKKHISHLAKTKSPKFRRQKRLKGKEDGELGCNGLVACQREGGVRLWSIEDGRWKFCLVGDDGRERLVERVST